MRGISTKQAVIVIALSVALSGACSTKLVVDESTGPAPVVGQVEKVAGIPFREVRSHKLHLFAYNDRDQEFEKVSEEERVIASPDAVYYLAADPELFSSRTLKLKFSPSGTLKTIDLSSESKARETAEALLGEVEKLQTAAVAEEAEALTASEKIKTDDLACVRAEVALDIAEATEGALPGTATELERISAEGQVKIARQERDNACNTN